MKALNVIVFLFASMGLFAKTEEVGLKPLIFRLPVEQEIRGADMWRVVEESQRFCTAPVLNNDYFIYTTEGYNLDHVKLYQNNGVANTRYLQIEMFKYAPNGELYGRAGLSTLCTEK